MPLYEFRCESCGHEMETLVAFSDPIPTTCEACGGPLKKLLSAPAVQFKGSGFYLTDYGRSGSSGGPSRSSGPDAGGAKGAETKPAGESKPGAGSGSPAAPGSDAKPAG